MNDAQFNDWFASLPAPVERTAARVVKQSIAQGTKVPPGTAIDLVAGAAGGYPDPDLSGRPPRLRRQHGRRHRELAGVRKRSCSQRDSQYNSAAEVPAGEKAAIIAALGSQVKVDDTDPGRTFDQVFNTLRNVAVFR